MEAHLARKYTSYDEASSQMVRTKEEDMRRGGVVFPKYDIVTSNVSFESDDSISIRQIANDDEKSAMFQEMLFMTVATRVLRRNRKLFEELAKY